MKMAELLLVRIGTARKVMKHVEGIGLAIGVFQGTFCDLKPKIFIFFCRCLGLFCEAKKQFLFQN